MMLRPRVIPCLLVHDGGLVKTRRFGDPKYVGDPLNAVRIYNEMTVDELAVLDIDATVRGKRPDMALIASLAAECRMPLTYGGGVSEVDQAEQIVSLGVEKVALGDATVSRPELLAEIAERIGSQSVVAVMDVKQAGSSYEVAVRNGTVPTGQHPVGLAIRAAQMGAGEVILNSIDRDGEMTGYDIALASAIREAVMTPITVLGGAGCFEHIRELVAALGPVGAGAGSMFVFRGRFRAVMLSYLGEAEQEELASVTEKWFGCGSFSSVEKS